MKRRTLLRTAAASATTAAGCLSGLGPGGAPSKTPAHRVDRSGCPGPTSDAPSTPTRPPDGDVLRRVRVTAVDGVPDIVPIVPAVEVVRPWATRTRPARLRVTYRNLADRRVYNTARAKVRRVWDSLDEHPGVLLLPSASDVETTGEGCWRPAPPKGPFGSDVVGPHAYEPCGSASVTLDVFGQPDNTGACLPPGAYELFDRLHVDDDDAVDDDAEWEYPWRFHLSVERP